MKMEQRKVRDDSYDKERRKKILNIGKVVRIPTWQGWTILNLYLAKLSVLPCFADGDILLCLASLVPQGTNRAEAVVGRLLPLFLHHLPPDTGDQGS